MSGACPTTEQLAAALRGRPSSAAEAELAAHLAECPACRARLEEIAGGSSWLETQAKAHAASAKSASEFLDKAMQALEARSSGQEAETALSPRLDFLQPSDQPGLLGRFGPYQILEVIAIGGMGIVLKARDPALNRIVALKLLPPALAANALARARFIREARAAAAVVHEHVVPIYAVDEFAGLPYLVMQFVQGRTLAERIKATGPLALEEILRIGAQTAAGLAAAHAQGLIHRDVKPGNILLENGVERVKITDFGLARAADDSSLTQEGHIAGTPEYMSPEQASGEAIDARSDLFGLGCILYAMATGASPFRAETSLAVLRRVCDYTPRPLVEGAPGTPRWFSELVECLMAKKPDERFQTSAEVEATLAACLRTVSSGGEPDLDGWGFPVPRAAPARRARRLRLAASAALVLLVGGVIWRVTRPSAPSNQPFAVLAGGGAARGSFASFPAAIDAARPGDIVELRLNGAFTPGPVRVRGKALTIRAGARFAPEWRHDVRSGPALASDAPLVLEGLLFTGLPPANMPDLTRQNWHTRPTQAVPVSGESMLHSAGAVLLMAHCQFRNPWEAVAGRPGTADITVSNAAHTELRHCRLMTPWIKGIVWRHQSSGTTAQSARLILTNCVVFNEENLWLEAGPQTRLEVDISRTVFRERAALVLARAEAPQSIRLATRQSVFDTRFAVDDERPAPAPPLNAVCQWEDGTNLFSHGNLFVDSPGYPARPAGAQRLAAWNEHWGRDGGSVIGQFTLTAEAPPGVPTNAVPGAFFVNYLTVLHGSVAMTSQTPDFGVDTRAAAPGSAGHDRWRLSPAYEEWRAYVARVLGATP